MHSFEVLAHDAVRALIDADYLFWASDIMTMEAHEVSRALNVRRVGAEMIATHALTII